MTNIVNLADLGRRVRAARLSRRLTLDDVVSRAKFTVSWLSKLENGQLAPSLEGLVKLSEVLECGVDTLVEGLTIAPQYEVVRHGEGRKEPARNGLSGYVPESLADRWRDRAMTPVIVHLSGVGNRQRPDNHGGERFLLVLEGDLRLDYGDEQINLATGDSVYIYAAIPHVLAPAGRGTAKVLSVSYDPRPETAHTHGPEADNDGPRRRVAKPASKPRRADAARKGTKPTGRDRS